MTLRPYLTEAFVLALAAGLIGAAINAPRSNRLPMRIPAGFYQVESKTKTLLLPQARALFEERKAIFLDARSNDEFEHGRILGSFSVPVEEWSYLRADLEPWIEGQTVVIYAASDQISRADALAGALKSREQAGSIAIYLGGMDEWRAAGLPTEDGPAPLLNPGSEGEDGW